MKHATESALELSDPTEWLSTGLSGLAPVDAALRCQVCKDFYNTPMITSCSHTFCSICIRRCLAADGKCPTCRSTEQEVKLRRNWVIDEIVDAFQRTRASALLFARQRQSEPFEGDRKPAKRKRAETDVDQNENGYQGRKTRSQSRRDVSHNSVDDVIVIEDDTKDDLEQTDGLVPCPMCGRRMKEESVYLHLDRCEEEQKRNVDQRTRASLGPPPQQKLTSQLASSKNERLPKLTYSLFKDNALRKKLNDLGIRASGPRSVLEKRHTEWVNLWNANCDSSSPRSKREVLQELDLWERSQGTLAPTSSGPGSTLMKKDFDGSAWAASHDSEFRQLIKNARRKRGGPTHTQNEPGNPSEPEKNVESVISGAEEITRGDSMDTSPDSLPVESLDISPNISTNSALLPNSDQASQRAIVGQKYSLDHGANLSGRMPRIAESTLDERPGEDVDESSPQPKSLASPSKSSQTPPITSNFFTSPTRSRSLEDADDPIVDSASGVPV